MRLMVDRSYVPSRRTRKRTKMKTKTKTKTKMKYIFRGPLEFVLDVFG